LQKILRGLIHFDRGVVGTERGGSEEELAFVPNLLEGLGSGSSVASIVNSAVGSRAADVFFVFFCGALKHTVGYEV